MRRAGSLGAALCRMPCIGWCSHMEPPSELCHGYRHRKKRNIAGEHVEVPTRAGEEVSGVKDFSKILLALGWLFRRSKENVTMSSPRSGMTVQDERL